ncbi:ATP-binding protein [Paraglaciecola sp. MB-3u-78]|jgi:PAS domain S-box-containing protein|uniref:GAF domain-containing sensor histidine kinase n=1 Tax=Paraglaciecola sp. MB-3u-78 TaxID=2058332 RepID=UPI000C34B463|nr:ATP-binding protein [Paraglaciecola sp. MB-3u-78]PKG93241.1 PAS domain S-box protein [Paraglaciecola sp. MB-3u-78]
MSSGKKFRVPTIIKYNLLDAEIDTMFNDIVMFAAKSCDKLFAMVNFIDVDKLWVFSQVGLFPNEMDQKNDFCKHTVNQTGVLEISDTLLNERTKLNKVVKETPNIRYYAGVPLINTEEQILGTLCVFDTKPNMLNKHQKSILKLLAKDVVSQLELRRKNFELSKLTDLNQLITKNNPDLVFAKDSDYKILHANTAFLSLFPEKMRDKVIGSSALERYSDAAAATFIVQDKLAFEQGKAETIEKITFSNGEIRTLFITKTRFEDDKGKAYIFGIARDVTEREALIEKLKKSNSDLEEFAYIASHDLKAPLNAIKRLVSWIEEDASEVLQGESLEHFGMIKNRIDRMNMLLKDLLDYSRVGKNDGLPQTLNLQKTAKHCYQLLNLPQGFKIDIDDIDLVLPKVPLELVLTNLISNAVKHHFKKSGHIKIHCKNLAHDYQISVTDDGPGIDPSLHEKIFMKFQTLKPRDEVEGSGLGLAIVEKALANYSANIAVKSDIGKGATFTVTWPKLEASHK